MRRMESVFALLVSLICMIYLFFVWKMDVGTISEPGPGFMPAVVGVMGLVSALLILVGSLKKSAVADEAGKASRDGIWRFIGCVVTTTAFIAIFKILGTIISIGLLVLLMNKILGAKGWLRPVVLAVCCAVISYGLFVVMLDVPLPRGIL